MEGAENAKEQTFRRTLYSIQKKWRVGKRKCYDFYIFYIIGKSSVLPYDTKTLREDAQGLTSEARVRKRRGNCRLKATRLRRRILLCSILIQCYEDFVIKVSYNRIRQAAPNCKGSLMMRCRPGWSIHCLQKGSRWFPSCKVSAGGPESFIKKTVNIRWCSARSAIIVRMGEN